MLRLQPVSCVAEPGHAHAMGACFALWVCPAGHARQAADENRAQRNSSLPQNGMLAATWRPGLGPGSITSIGFLASLSFGPR